MLDQPAVIPSDPGALTDRLLLDEVAGKWAILVLGALCHGPLRFNALLRALDGVTQKALTQCLRRLERNGILARRVLATSPVAVEYAITPLGRSLRGPFQALHDWAVQHRDEVQAARADYDGSSMLDAVPGP